MSTVRPLSSSIVSGCVFRSKNAIAALGTSTDTDTRLTLRPSPNASAGAHTGGGGRFTPARNWPDRWRVDIQAVGATPTVAVVAVARTAVRPVDGELAGWNPVLLAGVVGREALERAGLDAGDLDEVVVGCADPARAGPHRAGDRAGPVLGDAAGRGRPQPHLRRTLGRGGRKVRGGRRAAARPETGRAQPSWRWRPGRATPPRGTYTPATRWPPTACAHGVKLRSACLHRERLGPLIDWHRDMSDDRVEALWIDGHSSPPGRWWIGGANNGLMVPEPTPFLGMGCATLGNFGS